MHETGRLLSWQQSESCKQGLFNARQHPRLEDASRGWQEGWTKRLFLKNSTPDDWISQVLSLEIFIYRSSGFEPRNGGIILGSRSEDCLKNHCSLLQVFDKVADCRPSVLGRSSDCNIVHQTHNVVSPQYSICDRHCILVQCSSTNTSTQLIYFIVNYSCSLTAVFISWARLIRGC